jgi:hypothetical protein
VDKKGKIHYAPEIHGIIDKHGKVFGPIPPGVPPDRGFVHMIELEEGESQSSPHLIDTQRSTRMK